MSWHQQPYNVRTGSSTEGGGEWSEFQSGPATSGGNVFPSPGVGGGFNPPPQQHQQQWFPSSQQQYGNSGVTNQMGHQPLPQGYGGMTGHYGNAQTGGHTNYGHGGFGMGPQGMGMGPQGIGMGPQQVLGTGPQQLPGMGPQQVPGIGPQQVLGMGPQQVPGMGPGNQMFQYQTPNPNQPRGGPPPSQSATPTVNQQSTETPEQQRIRFEKEEQMKREDEIRKRRLANIKISKGGQSDTSSIAIESLIGFDPKAPVKSTATPPISRATPPTSRATPPSVIKREQSPSVVTTNKQPPVTQSPPITSMNTEHKPTPSVTNYEDMLSGTLMDLSKTVSNTVKSTDFKRPNNPMTSSTVHQQQHKTEFMESNKARQWGTGDTRGSGFEGLFAQHAPPPQSVPPTQLISSEDDGFGEFQGGDQIQGQTLPSQLGPCPSQGGPHPSQGIYNVQLHPSGGIQGPSPIPAHVTHPQAQSPQVVHTSSFNNPVMMTTPQITLPHWITARNYFLPSIYTDVLKKCSQGDDSDLMNTSILFPILSSSGIDRAVLRDMWSEVNKTVPGSLTRNELVCLLAMIGVLQGSDDKKSVSVSDLSSLLVPPPVTLTTSDANNTESSLQQKEGEKDVSHAPSVSPAPSDNDPYAVFKSMVSTSSDTKSLSDHTPSPAPLLPVSSDEVIDPSDPYAAFKVLTSSSSDLSSATPTSIQPAPPTNIQPVLPTSIEPVPPTNTSLINTEPVSGWGDFTGQQPHPQATDQSDVFGEFSVGVMTSSTGSHGNWADFNSHTSNVTPPTSNLGPPTSTTSTSDDLFGDFTGIAPLQLTIPSMGTTPLLPSTTPLVNATPIISSTTPLIPSKPSLMNATPKMDATPLETTAQSPSLEYKVKAVEHFEIWRTSLTRCDKLLEECVTVLCNDSVDQSLLEEISTYPGTLDRLLGIVEVYRFAERIHFASRGPGRKYMTPEKSQSLMTIMMGIKKKWNKLCDTMPNNKMTKLLKSSSSSHAHTGSTHNSNDAEKCCLCLLSSNISISSLFTIDGYNEHYTLPMTGTTGTSTDTSAGRVFHIQCMEFWTKGANRHLTAIP